MTAPWQDAQFAQLNIRLNPRLVQWVNRASQLEPRQRKGGWFAPSTYDGEPLHIGDPTAVTFYPNNGNEPEEGYYYDAITVAPLADRFMWLDNIERGWTQILGLAQDGETLVYLTGKGLTSRAYNRAIKRHNQWIAQATEGQAPGWAFWMALTAGNVQQFEQGGIVTHVDHQRGTDLRSAHIGDDAVRHVNSLADGIRLWTLEWSSSDAASPNEDDADESPAPSASAPPHRDSRYTNSSERGQRGSNAGAAANDVSDGSEASDLPTETLQRLLDRAGTAGIERFGRALDLALPQGDVGAALSMLVGEVPAAALWEDVPQARQLANGWVSKFQAARRQDEDSLDSLREYFKIDGANPDHVAAVIALAWLAKPTYREQIEGWINVWATSLTNQTS